MFFKFAKKQSIVTSLAVLTLPLVIISCGGGGGGAAPVAGLSVSTVAVPTNGLKIDSTNAVDISSVFTNFSGELLSGSGSGSSIVNGVSNSEISAKQSVVNVSKKFFITNASSVTGATTSCIGGGSRTSPDWKAPGSYTGTYTFTDNNCKKGNKTTNGTIVFTGSVTLDSSRNVTNVTAIDGTFIITNYTESDGNTISSIDGDTSILMSNTAGISKFGIKGSKLTFRDATEVVELKNFDVSFKNDTNSKIQTAGINFTISSSLINGSITVATPTTFKIFTGTPTKNFPYEGQIIVTGLNASKFRLTVDTPAAGGGIATDTVTIEIDADGANGYETSNTYMWSEL